jgi:hypothetical protein
MAIFDSNLVFQTIGTYQSLVTSTSVVSSVVIDLVNAREMAAANDGLGSVPKVVVFTSSSGITAACASATFQVQFQGSTDNTTFTTYIETPATTTTNLTANTMIASFDWPLRPPGVALPRYVRLNYVFANLLATTISTGAVWAGIVLEAPTNPVGNYSAGFQVS